MGFIGSTCCLFICLYLKCKMCSCPVKQTKVTLSQQKSKQPSLPSRNNKGKVFPLQAGLWPRGWVEVQLYSSMTAALEGGEGSASRPGRSLPRERPGTHCTGGWLGPRASVDGRKISPHRDSIPGHPARSQSLYRLSYPAHSRDNNLCFY